MEAPATVFVGSEVITTLLTAAGVMLKADEVAFVRLPSVAASVYPVPTLLIDRLLKVATPLTALTAALPLRIPPPGLLPMATVTLEVSVVTTFPKASSTAA